jgi:hypothetical protein
MADGKHSVNKSETNVVLLRFNQLKSSKLKIETFMFGHSGYIKIILKLYS